MTPQESVSRPPRIDIIHTVLESAREAGVTEYVEICRRLLAADRKGWRTHADRQDWNAVLEAYEEVCSREPADRNDDVD